MRKLPAFLLAALILLSLFALPVYAEEGSGSETPALEDQIGSEIDGGEEPLETQEPGAILEPADPQEEMEPGDGPAFGEEPAPAEGSDGAEEPDSGELPIPEEASQTQGERPHDRPRQEKSLEYWEKERANYPLTGDLREDILIIARSQLGYSADSTCYVEDDAGRRKYYTRYGAWDGAMYSEWCDMFVSFCIYYAGNESYPKDSSCGRHQLRLKSAGYWREWNSYVPRKGDIVFFTINTDKAMPNHVGLVEEVIPAEGNQPGQLITIEGNMGNPDGGTPCVRRMVRSLNSVVGYGTYEQGKVYPEEYTARSNGYHIIGEDSVYFVEYPTWEALEFLGLIDSQYGAYWFPEAPDEGPSEPELPQTEDPPAVSEPALPGKGRRALDMSGER